MRDLDADWTYEQDTLLFEMRDENPTPSFGVIAYRMTQAFGIPRTTSGVIGRYNRVIRESEQALAVATDRVRLKTLRDRVDEVRDPYHPLPEWFQEETPVQAQRRREFEAAKAKAAEDAARVTQREAEIAYHLKEVAKRDRRQVHKEMQVRLKGIEARAKAKEHRQPQRAVGSKRTGVDAWAELQPLPVHDPRMIPAKPRGPLPQRHYQPNW